MTKTQMALTWIRLYSRVKTPDGIGTVKLLDATNDAFFVEVVVRLDDRGYVTYHAEELEPLL